MALDLSRSWSKRTKAIALVVVALALIVAAVVALDKAVGGDALARA